MFGKISLIDLKASSSIVRWSERLPRIAEDLSEKFNGQQRRIQVLAARLDLMQIRNAIEGFAQVTAEHQLQRKKSEVSTKICSCRCCHESHRRLPRRDPQRSQRWVIEQRPRREQPISQITTILTPMC